LRIINDGIFDLGEWRQGKRLQKSDASTANSTIWVLSIETGTKKPPSVRITVSPNSLDNLETDTTDLFQKFEYKFFLIVNRMYLYEGGSPRFHFDEFVSSNGIVNINCIWQVCLLISSLSQSHLLQNLLSDVIECLIIDGSLAYVPIGDNRSGFVVFVLPSG